MTLYIEGLEDFDFEGLKELVDETLSGAVDTSFFNTSSELTVSFNQDLVGGETEDEFLARIAKSIWSKLGRYTPLGLNVIDLDSPVWDTYEDGEDTSYFEEAASEYYETKKTMYNSDDKTE